ncbi:MAG: hypothetical protein AAF441_24380, partial [Pseudomonadota bacterium]
KRRADELEEELEMIKACSANVSMPGARFVNGYGLAVIGAAQAYVETNIDFECTAVGETCLAAHRVPAEAAE